MTLRASLPELESLEALLRELPEGSSSVLATVTHGAEALPVHAIRFGPDNKRLPAIAFIGGVHGLERVGT